MHIHRYTVDVNTVLVYVIRHTASDGKPSNMETGKRKIIRCFAPVIR